ncbi:hypothetical protein B0H15DRAFT_952569 [Mycena belliarum]|uniref:Uncharacterized protein n=1 Tax=Mycena belliarum TaxID=1033014 RepID=A0AAD6XMU6_9AGAR|nr:hypothetical protein B0H15DRAFT_952569 [Mycena belliae]
MTFESESKIYDLMSFVSASCADTIGDTSFLDADSYLYASPSFIVEGSVTCDHWQDLHPITTTEAAPSSTGKSCNSKAREPNVYDQEVQMPTPNHSAELMQAGPVTAKLRDRKDEVFSMALPLQHEDETSWTALPALSGLFPIRVERFKLAGQHTADTPPQYTAPRNPVDLLAQGSTCGSPLNAIGLQSQRDFLLDELFSHFACVATSTFKSRFKDRVNSNSTLLTCSIRLEGFFRCSEQAHSPPSLQLAVFEPARASQDVHVVVVNDISHLFSTSGPPSASKYPTIMQRGTLATWMRRSSRAFGVADPIIGLDQRHAQRVAQPLSPAHHHHHHHHHHCIQLNSHTMAASNVAYTRPRPHMDADQIRAEILADLDPVPAYTPGHAQQLPAAYDRLPKYEEIANDVVVERGPPVNESSGLGLKVVRALAAVKQWVGTLSTATSPFPACVRTLNAACAAGFRRAATTVSTPTPDLAQFVQFARSVRFRASVSIPFVL